MFNNQLFSVKDKIILDLLGYIPEDNRFLINDINELISKGFSIDYNEGFIDSHEFDQRLSKCDIILGNLKVQMNVFRKYGETKETGILFNIIKSGKPGILPYEYPIDEELTDICLFFKNYTELGALILRMIDHPEIIANLKAKSRLAVKQYSPENLYHLLQE
jgi:hypothetical protein